MSEYHSQQFNRQKNGKTLQQIEKRESRKECSGSSDLQEEQR
jgi:hypothetical protein